jgi:hypothetical protein
LGDSQKCDRDADQDKGDSLGFLAHHFPPFFGFLLDTLRVLFSPTGSGSRGRHKNEMRIRVATMAIAFSTTSMSADDARGDKMLGSSQGFVLQHQRHRCQHRITTFQRRSQ